MTCWKIRLIESNAKCRHLQKFTCKGDLSQVFFCLRPPPLLGFCLGWSSNFGGSEPGQLQSVKLLQNTVQYGGMVSNRIRHPPPPPSHTMSVYRILYFDTRGGGVGVNLSKAGSKIPTWLPVSILKILMNTCRKVPLQVKFYVSFLISPDYPITIQELNFSHLYSLRSQL